MELFEVREYADYNMTEAGAFQYFQKIVKIELRLLLDDQSEKVIGEDNILIRVFGYASQNGKTLNSIKIELTSDVDIFFNYVNAFRQEEQINVEFEQFCANFQNIINQSIAQSNEKIVFLMEVGKPKGNLVFLENLGHKNTILLNISMTLASQEQVKQNIMFRYSKINKKIIDRDQKLEQINDYVKIKNPELLNILQRNLNIRDSNLEKQQVNSSKPQSPSIKKNPFH